MVSGKALHFFRDSITRELNTVGMAYWNRVRAEQVPSDYTDHKYSTVVGLQMLADIHEILGPEVALPAKRLQTTLKMMTLLMQSYGTFLRSPEIVHIDREVWSEEDAADLRGLKRFEARILNAAFVETKKDILAVRPGQKSTPAKILTTPFAPYSQNPVMSGLTMLGVHIHYQQTALPSIDAWWAIVPVAHLYNALKQESHLNFDWKRMETLIQTFTTEYIFFGDRPTEPHECLKRVRLAKGVAADMALPASASPTPVLGRRTRKKRKLGNKLPPFTRALHQWSLPEIPVRGKPRVAGSAGFQNKGLLLPVMRKAVDSTKKSHCSSSRPSAVEDESPELALLVAAKEGLAKEVPGLQLRLLSLNEDCINVLLGIYEEYGPLFREAGLDGYAERRGRDPLANSCLSHVVEDLLFFSTINVLRRKVLTKAAGILKTVLKQK
jgi:hypothetical protein